MDAAALVAFVGVSDLDRAEHFYGDVLGLPLRDERPIALVADLGGAELRITAVPSVAAAGYTVVGWRVADIDATVDELCAHGATFNHYDGMGQDSREVWTAPSGDRIAWFVDPDGNTLSLTEPSPRR